MIELLREEGLGVEVHELPDGVTASSADHRVDLRDVATMLDDWDHRVAKMKARNGR